MNLRRIQLFPIFRFILILIRISALREKKSKFFPALTRKVWNFTKKSEKDFMIFLKS